jgi:hypothetical protein
MLLDRYNPVVIFSFLASFSDRYALQIFPVIFVSQSNPGEPVKGMEVLLGILLL